MKNILLLTVFSLAVMGVAHAEKADSEKEAVITARSGHVDDVKQVRTLTGDVVLVINLKPHNRIPRLLRDAHD